MNSFMMPSFFSSFELIPLSRNWAGSLGLVLFVDAFNADLGLKSRGALSQKPAGEFCRAALLAALSADRDNWGWAEHMVTWADSLVRPRQKEWTPRPDHGCPTVGPFLMPDIRCTRYRREVDFSLRPKRSQRYLQASANTR